MIFLSFIIKRFLNYFIPIHFIVKEKFIELMINYIILLYFNGTFIFYEL
jgi:hypothetical protein